MYRTAVLAFALCVLPAVACLADSPAMWLGDGSGVFPDQDPPVTWDANSGKNILWKTPLPNWCNGSPVVADGRVFLLAEPLDFAPLLVCIDAETGKELWRRRLDATAALPPELRREAAALAREMWDWNRSMIALWGEMHAFRQANKQHFNGLKPGDEVKAHWNAFLARAGRLGVSFSRFHTGAGGLHAYLDVPRHGKIDQRKRRLRDLGLSWSQWVYFGTWDGVAYPTPITDGKRVWTVTAHNLYSCHDARGRLLWQRRFPPAIKDHLTPEQKKRLTGRRGLRWPYGWPGQGHFSTSPLMVDGKLISQAGMWIRCLDADTGRTLWQHPMRASIGQNMAVPGIIELGDTTAVIVSAGENRVGSAGDDVYRLSDGKHLGVLPGYTSAKMNVDRPIIAGDVVFHHTGHWKDRTIHATRLSLDGSGKLKTETLWTIKKNAIRGLSLWRMLVHDGKLFHRDVVLDATNGKLLADRLPAARRRYCWTDGLILGDRFLSIDHANGVFVFRKLMGREPLGRATLPVNPPGVDHDEVKRGNTKHARWPVLGAAMPFPYKDRLYIRSFDYLWCIGRK